MKKLLLRIHRQLSTTFYTGNFPYSLIPDAALREILFERARVTAESRRLIFCISSGRAGSAYLAKLLAGASEVSSFHEPRPQLTGRYLKLACKRPMEASYRARQIKVMAINKTLLDMPETRIYAETSHMFIKTFFDVVSDYYNNLNVILLRRDLASVLKSFVQLGYFSSSNPHWKLWMHRGDSPKNLTPSLEKFEDQDVFDRTIAYLLDIEARAEAYKENYRSVKTVDTSLERISSSIGAQKLFTSLNLNWTDEAEQTVNSVENARSQVKKTAGIQVSYKYCEQRLREYVARCQDQGIKLPVRLIKNYGI